MRFAGRVAIITGATYGIGFSVAQKLAREGAKVIITSRKKDNVQEATEKLKSEGLQVVGLVSHVGDINDRKTMFEKASKWGKLDILVLNAGVNPAVVPVLDTPESAWDKIFDVNLKASFMASKEALPLLRLSNAGRIIYMSTVGGYFHVNTLGAYTVSKIGLYGLTKMAALQLGKENITVNCVSPGVIETKFSKVLVSTDEDKSKFISNIPLGR